MAWLPDGEKKFDDILSRFDTIPACDGQTDTARRQKTSVVFAMHKRGYSRHAVSVCPSVCLSVRLSRSWIMSKRIKISSKFFHRRVATPF